MSPTQAARTAAVIMPSEETVEAAAVVEKFLMASMVPDPETAARYANVAAALSTTGYGAVTPMPRQAEVVKALSRA